MSVGFRKSLFGFNCDDVMSYIENTHKSFKEKEVELGEHIDELSESLNLTKEDYIKLSAEKEKISAELKAFTEKYEEIENLSNNIGKLYLVAQANARAIMSNSEKNYNLSSEEVKRNLYSIDEAHNSLSQMRENIIKTSAEFVEEVDRLVNSLTDTKEKIQNTTSSTEEHINEFEVMYKSLTK